MGQLSIFPYEPPSEKQIAYAQSLGIGEARTMSRFDLSQAIRAVKEAKARYEARLAKRRARQVIEEPKPDVVQPAPPRKRKPANVVASYRQEQAERVRRVEANQKGWDWSGCTLSERFGSGLLWRSDKPFGRWGW